MTRLRAALLGALLVAALLAVATVRQLRLGAKATADAEAALAAGDLATAVARSRDAAEAVIPGSPYPRAAYGRLDGIAHEAEAHGDERTATAAWGAMRTAATATEGPLVDTATWRARADDGLARIASHPLAPSAEVHPREDTVRASLARADPPSALALTLLAAGALAFFGGVARLAWAARDLASLRAERVALAIATVGVACYLVACFRS